MKITSKDVIEAIRAARKIDGSRGLAYIAGTRIAVEIASVRNMPRGGAMSAWNYTYTLIDPVYTLNDNRLLEQKGQGSFVPAVVRWLKSERRAEMWARFGRQQ